jgi:hypothetical protein
MSGRGALGLSAAMVCLSRCHTIAAACNRTSNARIAPGTQKTAHRHG